MELTLAFAAHLKKLILTGLVETATETALVRSSRGINRCFAVEKDGEVCLQTEGVNFEKLWSMPNELQLSKLTANDVHSLLCTYGVEAARAAISIQVYYSPIQTFSVVLFMCPDSHLRLRRCSGCTASALIRGTWDCLPTT